MKNGFINTFNQQLTSVTLYEKQFESLSIILILYIVAPESNKRYSHTNKLNMHLKNVLTLVLGLFYMHIVMYLVHILKQNKLYLIQNKRKRF